MNFAAGFSVLLILSALAAFPQPAQAEEDDAYKHELAETAPPSAEIADEQSETSNAETHPSDTVAEKPADGAHTNEAHIQDGAKPQTPNSDHGKADHPTEENAHKDDHAKPNKSEPDNADHAGKGPADGADVNEVHTQEETEPQTPNSEHDKADHPTEENAHKDDHAKPNEGAHDNADHAEKADDGHKDEGHSDKHTEKKKLSPLEQCYQAVANDAGAPEVSGDHSKSEKPRPTDAGQNSDQIEEPYVLIRTLEIVQDKIATGSRDAHIYQRELISKIAQKFIETPDHYWKSPKNSRAAILFALSGGDARILQKLLDLSPLPCVDDNLLKGLLAYSKGQNEIAQARLMKINPRELDSRAAAHLSLAQGMLIAADSPKEAIRYFDLARILAPGTLIEEAALRRASIIAALITDFDYFEMLSSQYLRRFSKSVYASEFLSRFAVAVCTTGYSMDDNLFEKLAQMLSNLPREEQRSAYVAVMEAAIVRGRVGLIRIAAKRLADFTKGDPGLAMQTKLYEAAVMIASDDYDRGLAQLNSLDRNSIAAADQSILDAALDLSEKLRQPPQITELANAPPPVSAEQGKQVEFQQTDKLIDSATMAIGQADNLLNGDGQ